MARRLDLPTLRAALWTLRALSRVRRSLRRDGLAGARVSAPPPLPAAAGRGVYAVLRSRTSSCLEQALVLQSWEAAHGAARDVVIGVRGPAAGFAAHAWVDGLPDRFAGGLHEITRLPPPGRA